MMIALRHKGNPRLKIKLLSVSLDEDGAFVEPSEIPNWASSARIHSLLFHTMEFMEKTKYTFGPVEYTLVPEQVDLPIPFLYALDSKGGH